MLRPHPILAFLCGLALTALAEARTLTAADGRTIDAEVVGFDGLDKVKVKRADTGQTFTLPISSFADADRDTLLTEAKAEASKPPPPPREGDMTLELSRNSDNSRQQNDPVLGYNGYDRGQIEVGSIKTTTNESSYTITLYNRTTHPIANLRIDYVLFVESGEKKINGQAPARTRTPGTTQIKLLQPNQRDSVKTRSVLTRKTTLKGRATWRDVHQELEPINLDGIVVRVYLGDTLILESATPPALAKEVPLTAPATLTPSTPGNQT